jgi:predicted RNA-binding Zn-ribbon protein involved in translation (DUF1610 family)
MRVKGPAILISIFIAVIISYLVKEVNVACFSSNENLLISPKVFCCLNCWEKVIPRAVKLVRQNNNRTACPQFYDVYYEYSLRLGLNIYVSTFKCDFLMWICVLF